ncbi:OmpH family outer membrane protein [Sphingomonas sp. 1P06PA]|uniref:OmpH family outer membrane protein n=1 Tax=Sphingomonas sp. 1P06PA TaxID=554121 RepID=UPI0039A52A69
MKKILSTLAIATGIAAVAPVSAQQAVGVVDLDRAVASVTALRTAEGQIQTQYKPQIDAFNARRTAATTELQNLQREIQTLQANSATPPATLQAKVTAFRTREAAIQRELAPLAAPFQRPLAYAQSQVTEKLEQALRAAMTAKRVGVVLNPQQAVLTLPSNDITADVTTQLNTLVKTVSTTPPANWQPGQPAAATPAAATPGR